MVQVAASHFQVSFSRLLRREGKKNRAPTNQLLLPEDPSQGAAVILEFNKEWIYMSKCKVYILCSANAGASSLSNSRRVFSRINED